MALPADIRRVVTGHDATGKAVVLFDGPNPNTIVRETTRVVNRLVWTTPGVPADISGSADRAVEPGAVLPKGGSAMRIVEFPPMTDAEIAALPASTVAKQFGSDKPSRYRPASHPLMHRTDTLDYAIVMAGEIDMLLDEETVHVKAGDVVIQQGTNHAWINTGTETCRIAFVFIEAVDPQP